MNDLRIDVQLHSLNLSKTGDRAVELADTGVDGLFSFDGSHDVFFPLVQAAGRAESELMTNIAVAFSRSPLHLAHAAHDLQLLSGGRFRLGLGSQTRVHIEKRYGSTWSRPAARMRETVLAIKAIFNAWNNGEKLDFRGEFTTHTLMTPNFSPEPSPHGPPPVLVGALGPRMTQNAAEVADGVLMMPFNSARHLTERTLPAIEAGLTDAGRDRGSFEIVAEVIVATGRDEEELTAARSAARSLLGFYASTPAYSPVLEVEGWQDLQPQLNELSKRGQWQAMADLIDEQMLATLAVVGTPEECARQIIERFGAHADRVCCNFPNPVADKRIAELVGALRGGS